MGPIIIGGIVLCGFMFLMSIIDGSDSSGEDTRTGGPSGCGWLMILAIIGAVLFFSGCGETPVKRQPFPLDPSYEEIQADPGRVVDERMARGWNADDLCAFVDLILKKVWLSRNMNCDWEISRRHEKCHIDAREAGIMDWRKDGCHKKFKPQTPIDPWVRQLGR